MTELRSRVAVISTGGTIAMEGAHRFDWLAYGSNGKVNPVAEICAALDLALPGIEIVPVTLKALPSTGIQPTDWLDLAHSIRALLATDEAMDGVVVTHGTASLEETAFFLHLVHKGRQPIIVTGAQRPPNTASSDAAANLRMAISCAADQRLSGAGALVCFNGLLHLAVDVTKTSNFGLDAFQSPSLGPVGRFDPDGELLFLHAPTGRLAGLFGDLDTSTPLPRVDIVVSYAGADGVAVEAFLAAGAKGLVSAGFPPGRSANKERAALEKAAANGALVIQCSRALRDRTPLQAYNSNVKVLSGGCMAPNKARIAAMLAIATGMGRDELQSCLLAQAL